MLQSIYFQLNNFMAFYNLFSVRQAASFLQNLPLSINLLRTAKCNLNCRICSAKDMLNIGNELTTGEIISFIEKNAEYKPIFFIGGGEPFIRKDILEFARVFSRNKLKYGIVTNGTLLNPEIMGELFNNKLNVLIFSLHGNQLQHDKVTGKSGAYSLISNNIKFAAKNKKSTKIILNFVINEENYLQLEQIIKFGKNQGVNQVRIEHLIFLTKNEYKQHLEVCRKLFPKNNTNLVIFKKDINNLEIGDFLKKEIPRLKKKYKNFVLFKPHLSQAEIESWYCENFQLNRKCFFVQHSVFVNPNGDIVPCQFLGNYKLGNIKEVELVDAWRNKASQNIKKTLKQKILPGCNRCCKL
ncbi:MAG: radical SAM protein [Candidatus Omnitrophota bacterium]